MNESYYLILAAFLFTVGGLGVLLRRNVLEATGRMRASGPAGGRPGALQFAGFGDNSCQCRTPIETYYGNVGPRLGVAYSLTERSVLRGSYGIMYSRRGAVGGRP